MPERPTGDIDWYPDPERLTCEVHDGPLMQPIGFVWFTKPRYRIKAKTRVVEYG